MFLKIIFIFGNIFKLNNICIFNSVEPGKSNSINFISSFEYWVFIRETLVHVGPRSNENRQEKLWCKRCDLCTHRLCVDAATTV